MLKVEANEGHARAGRLVTARGEVLTPCFMPVGTRGAVRLLSAVDLDQVGAQVVLANTYHLMMRPGAEAVAALGGLHRFTGWEGHFLTDSGGFQVMSVPCQVDDEGVTFRSTYDGSWCRLTPEGAVHAQQLLGADIQMALDVCLGLPAARHDLEVAGGRTLEWARRARDAHDRPGQMLFGIVQGGTELDLRASYAQALVAMGFDGYAIGGLSVGEKTAEMMAALASATAHLPPGQARYLMGVGDPRALVGALRLGVDMFDCVLPSRLGRHGTALTQNGRLAIKAGRYGADQGPLDPGCPCLTCARHSRAYLRHLFNVGEPSAGRLVTLHNLSWLGGLLSRAREAILQGSFAAFAHDIELVWGPAATG